MRYFLLPLSLAWACCPAMASPAVTDDSSETVRFADLDLGSSAGQAALQRRIDLAVRRVCREPGSRALEMREQERSCEAAARQRAGDSVSQMALSRSAPRETIGAPAIALSEGPGWR